jgi:hypothetical protein
MRALHRIATIGATTALVGASLLSTAGVASAASAPTTPPAEPTGCSTGELPVSVVGADGVKAQNDLGIYLWHGKTGYALRVTHPGKTEVVFSGSVTVTNTISAVRRVKLERADTVVVGPHRHTLSFRFTNYGYLDGVNFAAACSQDVKVTLLINKVAATPAQVFLGKDRTNPTSVPFTIERAVAPAVATVS